MEELKDIKSAKMYKAVAIYPGEYAYVDYVDCDSLVNDEYHFEHVPFGKDNELEYIGHKTKDDLAMNRAFFTPDGRSVTQIVWGPFWIVGRGADGNMVDIPDDKAEDYLKLFKYPHMFVGSEQGMRIYSKRDETLYVLEATIKREKSGRRRKG
jgi:hypothetical protein